jgi:hypothetical protein
MDERRNHLYMAMVKGEVQPEHGAEATYFNYGCRCDPCKAAHSAAERVRYQRRKEAHSRTAPAMGVQPADAVRR